MKSFSIVFVLLSIGGLVNAQTGPEKVLTADIDAQRAAIAAQRNSQESGFLSEDAGCYKKFAVNNCLEEVNTRRRAVMANLRRQEILLNDEQRKFKGEEQIRKGQEKASPESMQQDSERRTKAVEDFRGRQGRDQENLRRRNSAMANEAAARDAHAARLENHQKKNQARAEMQAKSVEEAKKFRERQIQAQERRAQHDAEQANRGKPASKPLPVPQ
jgi:colicin import membrane protein